MAAIRRPRPSGSLEFKVSLFYISSFRIETLPQKRRRGEERKEEEEEDEERKEKEKKKKEGK